MTRLAWWRLTAYVLVVAVAAWGLIQVDNSADDAHHAAVQVRREAERSEAERCRITLLSRQGSLDKDIRIFTRIGRQFDVDPEQMEILLNGIREDYAQLPVPADCRD